MDKTKAAIHNVLNKSGHHKTTVHETENKPVVQKVVKPTEHEDINTVVDREVHENHYHTTVQPIHDQEILPEQHKHRTYEVENREVDRRDHDHTKGVLEAGAQKFKDKHEVVDTTHTSAHAPVTEGETRHHHIHETIQPVLHKEVIEPKVVHTTVPIHEVHHEKDQHHATTALPPVHLSEYKQGGGTLGGRGEIVDQFDGCAKGVHSGGASSGLSGAAASTAAPNQKASSSDFSNDESIRVSKGTDSKKPSLLNKINPMTDSNGDGQKGFMK